MSGKENNNVSDRAQRTIDFAKNATASDDAAKKLMDNGMSPGLLRAMTDKQWDRVGLALGDEIRLKNHLATQETTNAA